LGPEANPLKCPCGTSYPAPSDPAVKPVCPSCKRAATTASPAEPSEEPAGLEKILIEKGWVTPDQVKAAVARQAQEAKEGRPVRLGESLVALGFAKPEQIREALALQGRTPMRCPTCKKTYNVKSPKPGTRVMCKVCRVPLSVPGSITDLHAEDTDTGTGLQPTLMGEAADPSLVDLIPGYAIERKLATGGMGEVFLARQKVLDRPVAIKLLPQDLAKDATYVQRFLAEARSAAKLSHENIVGAVDAGEAKGRYYFVMEYIQGETLFQIIHRDGELSERRALEITRQIARGLRHAHQQGLIHRDIKSANIMIGLDGTAKICDFGLAREVKVDVKLTQPGVVHSSPSYSSPEQCRAQKLDHRSDMYSLGVTLFEMLTRRVPFEHDVSSALFVAHATQPPPSPRSLNAAISPACNQFILRLLKKSPESRFRDYDELLAAVDQMVKVPPPSVPGTARHHPAPLQAKAADRGTGVKWALAAVGALVVVVLLMVVMKKGGTAERPGEEVASAADKGPEKLLKDARSFEERSWGKPSEYPAVRARWKGLVERFRGTPQHNQFAGPMVEFEARLSQEAETAAGALLEQARARLDAGKPAVALGLLRTYPAGYETTSGAAQVSTFAAQLEKTLDARLSEGKEHCWSLIVTEKFDEARKAIDDLRATLGYIDERGPQLARPSYREEFESLERKLEEERVFARKRAAEAAAKANPSAPPPPAAPSSAEKPSPPPVLKPLAKPPASAEKPEEQPRHAPPSGAELKQAEEIVRDLFKAEYAKKTSAAKVDLARKMFDLGRQTKDDPAGRFVLYREARDLAASGGELDLAYRAIDELAREYAINPATMKSVVLSELSLTARTPEELKGAAAAFLQLADEALESEDYAGAERAAGNAVQMARRAKDIPLVAKANAKAKECAELKAKLEKVSAAKEALKKNPDDPAANLVLGEYLCTAKGAWEDGLKHLAKGSDSALKVLAIRDQARPSEPADQMALGDGWWDHGEKAAEGRDELRRRAAVWYEAVIPKLTGIHKTRIQKRLGEVYGGPLDLLKMIDGSKDSVQGRWEVTAQGLVTSVGVWDRLQIPYAPPDEYDLTLVVERKAGSSNLEIGLAVAGRQFHIGIDGWGGGSITGLNLVDGKPGNTNETTYRGRLLAANVPSTVVCSVRKTGVALMVDGKAIFDWKGEFTRLNAGGTWRVPRSDALFIGAYDTRFLISRISLTPVSGTGRSLRE
jgi:hypothetical protein